jgi:hypothetical protein
MGVHKNITIDSFPKQGQWVGKEVEVCFHYNTGRLIKGKIIRDDAEDPFKTIIALDDGRVVSGGECQYSLPHLKDPPKEIQSTSVNHLMKILPSLAILLIALSTHAGTIKFPVGPNITMNAGKELNLVFSGSGFASDATCSIHLVDAKTWQSTYLWSAPIYNTSQQLAIPIPWNWMGPATYVVRIESGRSHATSGYTVRIRSAIVWPYGGSVYYHGRAGAVTWAVPPNFPIGADLLAVSLWPEGGGGIVYVNDGCDPLAGGCNFTVPDTIGTYRVVLEGYYIIPEWWDSEVDGDWPWESFAQAWSEKVFVR